MSDHCRSLSLLYFAICEIEPTYKPTLFLRPKYGLFATICKKSDHDQCLASMTGIRLAIRKHSGVSQRRKYQNDVPASRSFQIVYMAPPKWRKKGKAQASQQDISELHKQDQVGVGKALSDS